MTIRHNNTMVKLNYSKLSVISILLFAFLWLAFSNVFASPQIKQSTTYHTVYVNKGDTIWNIAAKYTTDKEDIRDMIAVIRQVNKLNNNAEIHPGQMLKVPSRSNT